MKDSIFTTVLPLAGGFWFVLRCRIPSLVSMQLGQAVAALLSTLAATVFGLVARCAVIALASFDIGIALSRAASAIWPAPFSGTSLAAFLLAVVSAEVFNRALKMRSVNCWAMNTFADPLVRLLVNSLSDLKPVSISLSNRKFYVGFVQEFPSLDPARAFVRLLPIMSGYRESETLCFKFTTFYAEALANASNRDDFIVVIPLHCIQTANLFDAATYERTFAAKPKIHQ